MKKFFLVLLSLIIVVALALVDFNLLEIDHLPGNINSLVHNGIQRPSDNSNEMLEVTELNSNELLFSFKDDADEIRNGIKEHYKTNGELKLPYLDMSLGSHSVKIQFSKGKIVEYKTLEYKILPLKEEDVLSYKKLKGDVLILPSATVGDIKKAITDAYSSNGRIEIANNLSINEGYHETEVKFTKNDMALKDTLEYKIEYSTDLYANRVAFDSISLPYGSSVEELRGLIRAQYETNGILTISSRIDMSLGSHTINASFIAGLKKIDISANYEIVANKNGLELSDPSIKFVDDSLEITYKMVNNTGIILHNLSAPFISLIHFNEYDYEAVAETVMDNIKINSLSNGYSTTITFKFNQYTFNAAYFMNEINKSVPFLYTTVD